METSQVESNGHAFQSTELSGHKVSQRSQSWPCLLCTRLASSVSASIPGVPTRTLRAGNEFECAKYSVPVYAAVSQLG